VATESGDQPTWIVLVRDLTDVAAVSGQEKTFVSLVLDADTGLARGVALGQTISEARTAAMTSAATTAVAPFTEVETPGRVLCPPGAGDDLATDVIAALGGGDLPLIAEVLMPPEAEDILDELVGHLSGRKLPDELPQAEDWEILVSRTWAYAESEPWQGWPDDLQLRIVVTAGGESTSYVGVVIGRDGLQAGLVLYPGRDQSAVVLPDDDWEPEDPLPFLDGSLLLHLNPPDDTLADMAAKAIRYGWPEDAAWMPVWLTAGPDGFADIDRIQAIHLTVALAGVLARHRRFASAKKAAKTIGTVELPGGPGRFTITDLT
jgi:hypothetical protein